MSDSRLLPTGSSPLEVAAAKACAEIEKTPVSIRELWNPDTCPANLLPWLAWAFSVDRWDEKWPEATKRAVIRDAYFIHCHKGTIGAIRRVVEPLGYLINVTEWWENSDPPGTFRLDIGVLESGITEAMYHGQNAHGIFLAVFLLSVDDNRKKRERKEAQYPGPHRQLLQLFKNAPGRLDTDRVRIAFVCQHHDAKVFFWNEGYVAAKSTSGARFMHP